jgi:hypothetical protein
LRRVLIQISFLKFFLLPIVGIFANQKESRSHCCKVKENYERLFQDAQNVLMNESIGPLL